MRSTLALFFFISSAVYAQQLDFRNARWGMGTRQVIAAESVELKKTNDESLAGLVTVDTRKMAIIYTFAGDRLAQAAYFLLDKYTEPSRYLIDVQALKKSLTDKYGTPHSEVEWRNPLFQGQPGKLGLAVAAGHVVLRETWKTDRTTIMLFAVGQNYNVSVGINYSSKELAPVLEAQKRAALKQVY